MRIYLILFLIIVFVGLCFPQTQKDKCEKKRDLYNAKIDSKKPAVYITYVKTSTFNYETRGVRDVYNVVWLRLHNNMNGTISFYTYDNSISLTGRSGIHYKIEKKSGKQTESKVKIKIPSGFPSGDFPNIAKLESGKSYYFGIPKFHLIKNTRVAIRFFYPWEVDDESEAGDQPSNYIYFYDNWVIDK